MNESWEDLQQLAGEYVLGTLDWEQRQQVTRRLSQEATLRSAVDAWEQRLLPLAALAQPQQPSAQLWPRIAADLAPHAAPAPNVRNLRSNWWNNLNLWRALAAGGFAAASVFGAMIVMQSAPLAPSFMVVLVAPQDQAPGWIVQASRDRTITLTPLRQVAVPADKALQFWTKGSDWQGPVSLGLVPPGKSLQLARNDLPPLQAGQLFEITLEPQTGSLTGKPSGPVLFIGKAVGVM